ATKAENDIFATRTPPLSSPYFLTTPKTNAAGVFRRCAESTFRIVRSIGFIARHLPSPACSLPRDWRSKPAPGLPGQRAHRVPGGQHDRLGVEGPAQFLGDRAPAGRDLEDVLVEPRVVHRVEAVLALVRAPAVLHAPLAGGTVDDVHPGEQHRVGHLGLVV